MSGSGGKGEHDDASPLVVAPPHEYLLEDDLLACQLPSISPAVKPVIATCNFEYLLDIGPDLNPRAALGDKGYDSKLNRDAARQRGICPAIPNRSNTKDVPASFPKSAPQGTVMCWIVVVQKLKRFKRIALRCE